MEHTEMNPGAKEWKKGWMLVLSGFFIAFITDGFVFSFGLMLVEIVDQFGEGRATTSGIVSFLAATQYLTGPLVSALAEKYGNRNVVITGALVSCFGFIMGSFATSVYHLWIAYGFLGGLGAGLMHASSKICVLLHFSKHRTLAYGITASGSGFGIIIISYSLRLLIDHFGWRGTLLLEAGIVLHGVVCGLLLRDSKTKYEKDLQKETTTFVSNVKTFYFSLFNIELLKDVKFVIFSLGVLFVAMAFNIPFAYIPDQVVQAGMTKTEATMLTTSIGIGNTVSRLIYGWIGDRVRFSKAIILMVVVLLLGVVTGLSPLMATFETKLVFTSLFGTLIGGFVTLGFAVLMDFVNPDLSSNAIGLVMLSYGIGTITGTPIAGYLFDQTGSYTITFIVCGVEFVVAAILLFICELLRRKEKFEDIVIAQISVT